MNPPDLRFIVKSTILKYLVCSSDISRDHILMLEYFEYFGQGVFGDEILSQIIEDFPNELTDELLIALSPPHLRHLKLTNCSRLSCNGLQKTIFKCQQLQALDFSECIHLLHPTVFCCLKDKASNLVSLSLENSQVVSDDIVQVVLMCCPGLKLLNLSGCRNITDAAFALSNTEKSQSSTASAYSTSSTHLSQPGCNLTSVDVSGCQCLSTVAVKYLVALCGANLKSINLAWTGVNCTAMLYLAGLSMDYVARLVQEADPALKPSEDVKQHSTYDTSADRQTRTEEQTFVARDKESAFHLQVMDANFEMSQHEMQDDGNVSHPCVSSSSVAGVELGIEPCDCDESQLNEFEVLRPKDVLPDMSKSLKTNDLQDFTGSSDEESDDSFKTATNETEPCFLSEEETGYAATMPESTSTDESLEFQEKCCNDMHGHSDIIGLDARVREFCSNVTTENIATFGMLEVNQNSSEMFCVSGDGVLLPCVQGETCKKLQKKLGSVQHNDGNPEMFSCFHEQSEGSDLAAEETFEDFFDAEKDPVIPCKVQRNMTGGQLHVTHQSVLKTHNSLDKDCNNAVMASMAVAGMKPDQTTMSHKGVKDEDYSDCDIVPLARMDDEKTEWSSEYMHMTKSDLLPNCNKEMSYEKLQCEDSRTQYVDMGEKDTENECCYSSVPHNGIETTLPAIPNNVKSCELNPSIKSCHGGEVTSTSGPHEEEINKQSKQMGTCLDAETRGTSNCLLSCSKAIQYSDFAQAQIYQPQITSLDITNICYQSKPLGEVCLKVFSKACKCLRNFAVSWTQLDDEVLIYFLKNEPELESLSLVDCENLSNISLCTLPVHCPKLTSFDLKGICYVTDHGVVPLTRSNDLQSLCLAEAAITDSTLESISKGCGAKLKELDISWCEDITDRGMSIMANSCSSLQHLSLRQCVASRFTLNALAANCHLISTLNIAGVNSLTDTALSNLAQNMPLLREIDASWNASLSDIGVSALLECCTQLNKAVLCGLKRITSQPFLAIIGDLGRWCLLEELWTYSRRSQSGVPAGKVALKTCDVEKAKFLGDQIPWRSMSYVPSLRQILLEYSDKVNDDHLAAVVAVCRGTLFIKDYYGQPVEPKWIFR